MLNDPVVKLMKRYQMPVTRENYLELAYMGEVPEELSAEQELALPKKLQKQRNGGLVLI
jgi:hypothetical protein